MQKKGQLTVQPNRLYQVLKHLVN